MRNTKKVPTVFISYSWDSKEHKKWVRDLSDKLSLEGVKTILDQKDLKLGDYFTLFMERSVEESDFVLLICTPTYKKKADQRLGGVGYEESIITTEILNIRNHRKYITILSSGDWVSSVPTWAIGKSGVDLSSEDVFEDNFKMLTDTILDRDSDNTTKTNMIPSYEHLLGCFQSSSESLQIALLENICNICSQVDIIDSYGVLEDLCLFLDKIESSVMLGEKVKPIYAKAKEYAERLLIEDMRDLWNGR